MFVNWDNFLMQSKQDPTISPVEAPTKGASSSFDVKITSNNSNETQKINSSHLLTPITDNVNQEIVQLFNRQGFRISDYNFMVKCEDANKIIEIPAIYPLANAPKWFLGMANMNGQPLPVFDLKSYFGITDSQKNDKKKPMLFVLQQAENAIGIIIDGLLERLAISDKQIQDNIDIPHNLGNFINNAYLLNQEIWYDIDYLAFLDKIEARIIIN